MNPSATENYASLRAASAATHGCNTDARLRRFGFEIHSRAKSGPLWIRKGNYPGHTYTQEEALRIVERELKKLETA